MKAFVAILPYLIQLSWGVGGYFGAVFSERSKNNGLDGMYWILIGYMVWCVVTLVATRGSVLSGWQWSGVGIAFALSCSFGGLLLPVALHYSESRSSVVALSALYPVVTALMLFLFRGELLTAKRVFAVFLSVVVGWLMA